ncbi:MAG: hypothetical protein K2J02_03250, partial [Malacoplasma sp.]|nr:hypothetical protein [Malacoplasma sp.]MDE6894362.1 hypothetical protein [Malacoplasma sp.]
MKKFLKLGLCFLSLVPISLAVYSCSTNTRVEDDDYYDVSDKSTVKVIYDTKFGIEFWDDLLIYDKTIENNSEILKSDIQIDLRMFKYLQKINSRKAPEFFINIIDKWAKQFSTVGIDDFKGQVDYYFPDSFQGFIDSTLDIFYLPFQRNVDFGKATIKTTLVFNMNNDDTECIFPESVEKIYCQFSDKYPEKKYTNQNFLLTLRKIVFPSNFTVEKINCYSKNYAMVPFRRGSFFESIKKDENDSKIIGDDTYYYYYGSSSYDKDEYLLGYFTEKERELINQRLKFTKPMEIKISKTFENNDEALKYVFGWKLLDKEFELLKSWIEYI